MATVTFSFDAYRTAVFHALRYEHLVVCGLLIGQRSGEGWTISKVVPLFHSAVPLAPMSEAALSLVSSALAIPDELLGVYWASDVVLEPTVKQLVPAGVTALADSIASAHGAETEPLVVELESRAISAVPHVLCARAITRNGPRGTEWTPCSVAYSDASTAASMEEALREPSIPKVISAIVDFDAYLENPKLAWPVL